MQAEAVRIRQRGQPKRLGPSRQQSRLERRARKNNLRPNPSGRPFRGGAGLKVTVLELIEAEFNEGNDEKTLMLMLGLENVEVMR